MKDGEGGSMRFRWDDLRRHVEQSPEGSRERMACELLLSGLKVDLSQIPRRRGFRSPARVRRMLRNLLKEHDGVAYEGDVFWIPDLCLKDT